MSTASSGSSKAEADAASNLFSGGLAITNPTTTTTGSPIPPTYHFTNINLIKVSAENFLLWRAQLLSVLKTHLLLGFINGRLRCPPQVIANPKAGETGAPAEINNPAYQAWMQQDQAIMSCIITNASDAVVGMLMTVITSLEAWTILENSFAPQSTARSMQLRFQLSRLQKGDAPMSVYFNRVKALTDIMASIGKPLEEEEVISYLLAGLDSDYDALVEVVTSRSTPMPLRDLYAQLLSSEFRVEGRKADLHGNNHSANIAFGKQSGGGGKFYRTDGRALPSIAPPTNGGGYSRAPAPSFSFNKGDGFRPADDGYAGNGGGNGGRPFCQLCGKVGHIAAKCFKLFKREFLGVGNDGGAAAQGGGAPQGGGARQGGGGAPRQAAAAITHAPQGQTPTFPVIDPAWYADTGATDHLTNDLNRLSMMQPYNGNEHVHTANGAGPSNTGNSA